MTNLRRVFSLVVLVAAFVILAGGGIAETVTAPGSGGDPLVTRGWVDRYVQQAFSPLTTEVADLTKDVASLSNKVSQVRPVLFLTVGSRRGVVGERQTDLELPPLLMGSRVFVPLRFIGESMGTSFQWDGQLKKISYIAQGQQIELVIGQKTALQGGGVVELDAPATVQAGRTLVPLRFISESLGADVIWHGETKTIEIR